MKGIILSDNRINRGSTFIAEHGFSFYGELLDKKFLVDVGASDVFLHNAKLLGVDISDVDYLFLSHGHNDHTGGLPYFLEVNKKAKIYAMESALKDAFFSMRNGVMHELSSPIMVNQIKNRLVTVSEKYVSVLPNVMIFSGFYKERLSYDFPVANQFLLRKSQLDIIAQKDDFCHELVVGFVENKKITLCTGCAHNGIESILHYVKNNVPQLDIAIVVGGFHLMQRDKKNTYETLDEIRTIANRLNNEYSETNFVTGHCTSEKAFEIMKPIMRDKLEFFSVGYSIKK